MAAGSGTLTTATIKAAKPGKAFDGGGLFLHVTDTGRYWRMKFRYAGKERLMAFGVFPAVSLSEARRKRDDARALLRNGIDPSAERRREKLKAVLGAANTFGGIADEFIATKLVSEGKATVTVAKARWLSSLLAPLARRPIAEIKPIEVLAVLKRLEAKELHETARRARSFASRVFRYAVATARTENDPAALLKGALIAPTVTHHAAIIEPKAVGELLRAISDYQGQPITRLAMLVAPHVMVRPGELRQARWEEFDLDAAIWRIPAVRMKARRLHAVPLSRQVLARFAELRELSGGQGFVFPAFHTSRRPISENTVNQAFRRMGYAKGIVTAHGLRTTASTLLNQSGKWNPDAIERALAHGDSDAVRGAYNRGEYWLERVEMAQWWSDYLDTLREGAKVINMQSHKR